MITNLRSIQATALTLFTEEFQQNLPQILTALDTVKADRSNRGAAREAHRLIHALKGGASMVGLAAFGYLLNVAEELIEETTGLGPLAPLPPNKSCVTKLKSLITPCCTDASPEPFSTSLMLAPSAAAASSCAWPLSCPSNLPCSGGSSWVINGRICTASTLE